MRDREGILLSCHVIAFRNQILITQSLRYFFPSGVLQKLSVNIHCMQLNVPDHRSTHEAIFNTRELRVGRRIHYCCVVQPHVQVLVYRVQRPAHGDVILELYYHLFAYQRLEE